MESARTTTTSCWFAARTCLAALLLSGVALQGAARQVPLAGGVPSPLPGVPVALPEPPSLVAWSVSIPSAPTVSPLVAGEAVVVGYLPGIVAAHHAADGRQLWSAALAPEQRLVADGPLVYVAAGEAIHALRLADGSVAWRSPAGALSAPPLAQDGWLLTTSGGALSARRAADGTAVWTVESGEQREPSVISGDMIVTPLVDGRLVARELLTGQVRWERRLGGAPGTPAVIGDDVFVGASDRRFYCVDAVSGEIDWHRRVGATIRGSASTDGERIFFAALDNLVRALDRRDGALRWQAAVNFRPLTGALAAGGAVFVAAPDREVRILRAVDGKASGRLNFPSRLALEPGFAATGAGAVFAAVTGNLEESWRLSLTFPVSVPGSMPATSPALR